PELMHQGWFHVKLTLVIVMTAVHGFLARWHKAFDRDRNIHTSRFYRIINEAPPVLVVFIVILVIVKPF
ncbi:MAG: CopD family protein, partial [Parvibaculum sp.]